MLAEAGAFCAALSVDIDATAAVEKLVRLKLIGDAVEVMIGPDERWRDFLRRADRRR